MLAEQFRQELPSFVRTESDEETADIILEQNNQHQDTYIDHFVEDCAHQPHFQYLRYQNPNDNKRYDTAEYRQGAGTLHQFVSLIKEVSD